MSDQFPNLFSPLKIGPKTMPNRLCMTSHHIMMSKDGEPLEEAAKYYEVRAAGGVGLIVAGPYDTHDSMYEPGTCHLWDEKTLPGFKRIADAVHKHDSVLVGQIWHTGRQAYGKGSKEAPWAPSAIPLLIGAGKQKVYATPREMTVDDIKAVVEGFALGAARLEKAGFDGCEIHASHGYLLAQFLSLYSNQRQDDYGGPLENRMRMMLEVIDAVKASVSDKFVVGLRLVGDEYVDQGITLDDTLVIAPALEATGKLDYMNISVGNYSTIGAIMPGMYYPPGCFVHVAAAVKDVVELPLGCVARINDPVQAEDILANHQADIIGMARALICDPELPKKAQEGRVDEIRRCLACNEGCISALMLGRRIGCAFNPETGKESELKIEPASSRKKVMVIGGGPAGLEAARVAAIRGHEVSLAEKSDSIGGQMLLASKAPDRSDFDEVPRFYQHEMERLNVDVKTGTEVSVEDIKSSKPDAVIVATGSNLPAPAYEGSGNGNLVNVRELLGDSVSLDGINKAVVVIDGFHNQGLSAADFLADREISVTCIVNGITGMDMGGADFNNMEMLIPRLQKKDVRIVPGHKVIEISGSKVVAKKFGSKDTHTEDNVDLVVIATKPAKNETLSEVLNEAGIEVHIIGEATKNMRLMDALADGFNIGNKI